MQVIT